MPLEWTGLRRACFESDSDLPATQGQRYTTMLEVGVAARPGQSPHQHPHPA